jgi:hypothetical protein
VKQTTRPGVRQPAPPQRQRVWGDLWCVRDYLAGMVEWAGLYQAITAALIGECDRMFQFEMARIQTAPFVMKTPGEKDG